MAAVFLMGELLRHRYGRALVEGQKGKTMKAMKRSGDMGSPRHLYPLFMLFMVTSPDRHYFWQNWQLTMRTSLQKGLFFKYCLTD
jgi:hypothetical protein